MWVTQTLLLVNLIFNSFLSISSLQWHRIRNSRHRGTFCNDFSHAGYFLRRNPNSTHWLIFLEGGGGCTSIKQCNERYIDHRVRRLFTDEDNNVDTSAAWSAYTTIGEQSMAISKLMTSLGRYRTNMQWKVKGTDMFSTDPEDNPSFFEYNHVLIPYCSSDLWLGAAKNYAKFSNNNSDRRFVYDPLSTVNQFTFRGVAIFQSIVVDLLNMHGLSTGTDVVLAGSSAGGIGALNHARWLKDSLTPSTKLSVIADSAWFVDFRREVKSNFDELQDDILGDGNQLICPDPTDCIFAETILSDDDFPQDVPVLMIFSEYDLYLLSTFLSNTSETGVVSLMRVVSEYSGSMISSLYNAANHNPLLSYYVSSCFQHVYLANSELWGSNGLLGDEAIDETVLNNRFT